MDVIDLDTIRQTRQAVPLTRAANALLATATDLSQSGVDKDLLLRATTIALAKLVVECATTDEAERIARSIADSLPRLVRHLEERRHEED